LKKKETNARIFKQLHFVLEPFASYAFVPTDNLEAGLNFLLKVGFAEKKDKFQPYFKIGTGGMYMTKHSVEQSTQLNFNDNIGAGAHYYFKKDTAFTLEYRFRHISNASIKLPNVGINASIILFSFSYFF
jgi:outer membrane protein W